MPSWFTRHTPTTTTTTTTTTTRHKNNIQPPPTTPTDLSVRPINQQHHHHYQLTQSSSSSLSPPDTNLQQHHHHLQNQQHHPTDEVEVLTQSLAIRLEELATANHDGLLDDDEYRTLRKGLFDQINAGNQHPTLAERSPNSLSRTPSRSYYSPPFDTLSHHFIPNPPHLPYDPTSLSSNQKQTHNESSGSKSTRSIRSSSSLLHKLFKRQSRGGAPSSYESHSAFGSEDRSACISPTKESARSIHSSLQPDSNDHSSRFQSARSMRIRSNTHLYSPSEFPPNPSLRSSDSVHNARSERSSHRPPASPIRASSSSSSRPTDHHLAPKDDYRQIEWTAEQIKQEINELELECAKLLETFNVMEKNLVSKYRTVPHSSPMGAPTSPFDGSDRMRSPNSQPFCPSPPSSSPPFTTPTSQIGMVIHEPTRSSTLHPPSFSSSSSPTPTNKPTASFKHRPTSFLAPLVKRNSIKTKAGHSLYRDIKPSMTSSSVKPTNTSIFRGHRPSTRTTPSTTTHRTEEIPKDQTILDPILKPSTSITTEQLFHTLDRITSNPSTGSGVGTAADMIGIGMTDPKHEIELADELKAIHASKLKVQNKYNDRLVYLRAKLKGALIRESNA